MVKHVLDATFVMYEGNLDPTCTIAAMHSLTLPKKVTHLHRSKKREILTLLLRLFTQRKYQKLEKKYVSRPLLTGF